MKERRKYRRVKTGIKFIYKVMGIRGEVILLSLDLGGGGMRLYLDKKFKPGTLVELGLSLPHDKQIFFALGRIVWQKIVPGKHRELGRRYVTGVEFLNLDIVNKTRLIHFVHGKLREEKNAARPVY